MNKSSTDLHWNDRAASEPDDARVNIADTAQREVELHAILPHLRAGDRVLEVGCGNGYVTDRLRRLVRHVDAFDYAENMVERARRLYGESNNRFFHDNVLAPRQWAGPYDAILCVRVLINLRDLGEQRQAIRNLAAALRPGGRLILAEGFRDGFDALDGLRAQAGLPPLQPAPINFYSRKAELMETILPLFTVAGSFHTGLFDVLTRVALPAAIGAGNAQTSDFHHRIQGLATALNGPQFAPFGRVQGLALIRK
ncbi:MAG TPA: class I SAM-dependent methyltransferase [Magnetospirillum sp.]|nr:class I SAM-dependent methyltransferase [Magnetospirillum sp.]